MQTKCWPFFKQRSTQVLNMKIKRFELKWITWHAFKYLLSVLLDQQNNNWIMALPFYICKVVLSFSFSATLPDLKLASFQKYQELLLLWYIFYLILYCVSFNKYVALLSCQIWIRSEEKDGEWGRGAAVDPVSGWERGCSGFTIWCAFRHHSRQTTACLQCAAAEGNSSCFQLFVLF